MRFEPAVPAAVLQALSAPFAALNAEPLDAPVLQPLGVLLELAGETLRERLFVVQGDGPEACLRPDFTIPALRAHLASGRTEGRYAYSGRVFRVAPAGSDQPEEFTQIGLEAFERGDAAAADAEIAALAWRSASAGGRDDLTLVLGDVGLFGSFVESLGVASPLAARLARAFSDPRRLNDELAQSAPDSDGGGRLARLLAGLEETEATAMLEEIWALAGVDPVGGRGAAEIVHRLARKAALAAAPRLTADQAAQLRRFLALSGPPEATLDAACNLSGTPSAALSSAREAWARRITALGAAGVPQDRMRFSAAFGRTLGYYDGALFEIRSAALSADDPVAAGGRYDGLAARLGADLGGAGALGCMVRPARAWAGATA